jgi:sugar phosphate isomerase/epimerase
VVADDPPGVSVGPGALAAEESGDQMVTESSEAVMTDSAYGGGGRNGPAWDAHIARCEPVFSVIWGPTPEDIERGKAENARIIEALEAAGVAYEVMTEPEGWERVEPADEDWEAFERAMSEYYEGQDGPPAEEVERMRQENQEMVDFLEERGVAYEVVTEGDGWERVEPTGEDGWKVMDEFWRQQERDDVRERAEANGIDPDEALACHDEERRLSQLNEQLFMFPFSMDASLAEQQIEMVQQLKAAFDEAGIDYDEVAVPILEWDLTAEGADEIVRRIAEEHGYGGGEMMMEAPVEEVVVLEDSTG